MIFIANKFRPGDIGDGSIKLTIDLDADISPMTLVSGKISQWNDLTVSANHFSNSTAGTRPVIAGSLLNNRQFVSFSSGNKLQKSSAVTNRGAPMSVFCVMRRTGANTNEATPVNFTRGSSAFNVPVYGYTSASVNRRVFNGNQDSASWVDMSTLTSWCVFHQRIYIGASSNYHLEEGVNGTVYHDATGTNSIDLLTQNVTLCTTVSGPAVVPLLTADIARVLVYTNPAASGTALSATDTQRVVDYLRGLYAI